jgi:lysosomal acid phosphatase
MYLLTLTLLIFCSSSVPIYLSQVFRHGARYPVNDLYDGTATKDFHGNLTTIGLRQHYLLGTYLAAEYSTTAKLYNLTLNPREV